MLDDELEKFDLEDEECPNQQRMGWMSFFLDLYDLLMKFGIQKEMRAEWIQRDFGIEEQCPRSVFVGLTSKPLNMLLFTTIDPEDRRIVICDGLASKAESFYFKFKKGGFAIWDKRYPIQAVANFIAEIDEVMMMHVNSTSGRRTQRRLKQP